MSGRVPDKAAWREATLAAADVRRTELLKKSPGILRPGPSEVTLSGNE